MNSLYENEGVRVQRARSCPLCGSKGELLYHDLRDYLFNAPGKWNLLKCSNPECGLIWLDPMPMEEEINKFYEGYYTHEFYGATNMPNTWLRRIHRLVKNGYLALKYGYENKSTSILVKLFGLLAYLYPGWRALLDFRVMYLPAQLRGRLLDVGCGSGWFLKNMKDLGWYVEGVDFDPIAVENAKKIGLTVHFGSLKNQQYPSNYFDAITMSHLIEHVYNPVQLLRECYRILKPGGSIVMVTPNGESWEHSIFKDNWRGLEPPRHLHIFTVQSLRCLVEKAGFVKIKTSTTVRDANGIFISSKLLQCREKCAPSGFQLQSIRILGRFMQLLEWILLSVKPNVGEEILLIAKK